MKVLHNNKKGFTLVELMVAVALGAFMLGVMSKVLIEMKKTSVTQVNVQKIQNDINFSMEKLKIDLRTGGFRGCISAYDPSLSWVNFSNSTGSSNYQTSMNAISGHSGNSGFTPSIDSTVSALSPLNTYDVLTVRQTVKDPLVLTTDMINKNDPMIVDSGGATNFATNDFAIISSCSATSLFKVLSATGTKIIATNAAGIGNRFVTGAQIYNYKTIIYYVATDGSKNNLYRKYGNNSPELVVTNVEKFKVLYGLDTNNDTNVDKHSFANNVVNFSQVVSVKVGIVIKAEDNNTIGSKKSAYKYNFFGTDFTPNDSILRKVVYINSSLRNKLP